MSEPETTPQPPTDGPTPEQRRLIRALGRCTFAPGSWAKMFVRNMQTWDRPLSERQAAALDNLRRQFRRQLAGVDPELVADLADEGPVPSERELERLRAWNAAARRFSGE